MEDTNKRLIPPGEKIEGADLPMSSMVTGSGNESDGPGTKGAQKSGYSDMGSITGSTKSDAPAKVPGSMNKR